MAFNRYSIHFSSSLTQTTHNSTKLQSDLAKLLAWMLSLHIDGVLCLQTIRISTQLQGKKMRSISLSVYVPATPPF